MFKNEPLAVYDKELSDLIMEEKQRQKESLNLIASENFINASLTEVLGSCLVNKYSEGYPGNRYYSGNEYIDKIELLCQKRALEAFNLSEEEWGVNVQALSGSPANIQTIYALVGLKGRILGMHLCSGGHLTHGFKVGDNKVSITSDMFESESYKCNAEGYIDYDEVRRIALSFKPHLIICGYSSYPRDLDYKRFREISDEVGAYMMCDMSHFSGLVAAKVLNNPFEYADVVTSTTHKMLRSVRSALIFFNKKKIPDIEKKINATVFPGFQGGPHNNQIAAVAHQLKEVNTDLYRKYATQVVLNSKALANCLISKNLDVITNGTDNHLMIIDLRKFDVTGSKVALVCDKINVGINKNTTPSDTSAAKPSGIRVGTPPMTTRGAKEHDMEFVAEVIVKAINIAVQIQEKYGKKLEDFKKGLVDNPEIAALKKEVVNWSSKFPIP